MTCRGCGNEQAYNVHTTYDDGHIEDVCDQCGVQTMTPVVDAYFNGEGTHYGIYDENGTVVNITSKTHKAYWMKRMKVREAGDRRHGAINFDPVYSRIARENYRTYLATGRIPGKEVQHGR